MSKEKLSDSESEVVDGENEDEDQELVEEVLSGKQRLVNLCSNLFWVFWCLCTISLLFFLGLGLLTMYSREMKMEIIFSNRIRTPFFANLSDCHSFGLIKCENIFIRGKDGKLGAWLISPSSKQYIIRDAYFLYLHGNMGSRALKHRVKLYQKLSKMGYHILALDYRGFGDSESFPTEEGLVQDAKAAYMWLLEKYPSAPLYIWGHSLGSGVAVQLGAILNGERTRVNGIILEAPFNNMTDAILQTPLAQPFIPFVPNFESYIADVRNVFKSSHWIQQVTTPMKILHDKSDHIINIALGYRLYVSAKQTGSTNVEFIELDEKLYHNYIYKASKLKVIIGNFVYGTS